jgi:hypothetical protein
LLITETAGKSDESMTPKSLVPVVRIKHSEAIELTRPMLGNPSNTMPPSRFGILSSLTLLSSIDEIFYHLSSVSKILSFI